MHFNACVPPGSVTVAGFGVHIGRVLLPVNRLDAGRAAVDGAGWMLRCVGAAAGQ